MANHLITWHRLNPLSMQPWSTQAVEALILQEKTKLDNRLGKKYES